MIVDVHSHASRFPGDYSDEFREQTKRIRGGAAEVDLTVRYEDYVATSPAETVTIVFGGKARLSGIWVSDEYIADYVGCHPDRLIGFMSLDPTQPGWQDEMRAGRETLGLRGIKLLPMYAGFRPDDLALDPLWEYASAWRLPVILHTGTTFISHAPLDCTLPRHLDVVATRFPDVKIIMAHLGHPYEGECIVTARKHDNVYADISALFYRPWQLYNSLMLAQEYGVWNKILFGTDYPVTTVHDTIAGVRGLNSMLAGTALPRLNESEIEAMITRDSLKLLGLSDALTI